MDKKKVIVQVVCGLVLAFSVMVMRGLFESDSLGGIVMAIGDGFTVAAVMYLGFGALMWVSSTGFFDIFGYAVKKAAHALVPGMVEDDAGRYYEYKIKNEEKRKNFSGNLTLKLGVVFLIISILFLVLWYQVM